jgi:nicotinate-nucleotide pyrophosphorylase
MLVVGGQVDSGKLIRWTFTLTLIQNEDGVLIAGQSVAAQYLKWKLECGLVNIELSFADGEYLNAQDWVCTVHSSKHC